MLRLNVTQEKQLTFEVQIGGVQYDQITSQFKIVLDEIEYGFPAKVGRETIVVQLPPLNKVIGTKIVEGVEAEVKLEVIADGHYLTPWRDRATLSNPLVVEAKIKDTSFVPNPSFETKLVVEEDGAKQTVIAEKIEEKTTDQKIEELSKKIKQLLENQKQQTNEEKKKETDENLSETDKEQVLENLLNKTIDKFSLSKKKKKITLEEFKKNLTKEDIFYYIAKKGTKKPEVQEVIYKQAKAMAKKDTPPYILKEVIKILKR